MFISDKAGGIMEWEYQAKPQEGDCRKLVTLLEAGMVWVGLRAWHGIEGRWYNGNDPEKAEVLAWMDLPQAAPKRWVRGKLVPDPEADKAVVDRIVKAAEDALKKERKIS
jgi:hypothetical protein